MTDDEIMKIAKPFMREMADCWYEYGIHEENVCDFAREIEKAVQERKPSLEG